MATSSRNIKYTITVDEKGAITGIEKFGNAVKSSGKKSEKSFGDFSQTAVKAIAAVYAVYKTLEKAIEMSKIGSKLLIQAEAFDNLAASQGVSSKKIIQNLNEMAQGTIKTSVLMEKAGTAMLLGIPAEELDDLMGIARATMKITGQTAEEAFGDIALAVGRGSKMILDNLGIIVDVGKANEDYARKLGKTVEQLTDAEKKQAFLNATIERGKELQAAIGETSNKDLENVNRLTKQFGDLWDNIYKLFADLLGPYLGIFADLLESVNKGLEKFVNNSKEAQKQKLKDIIAAGGEQGTYDPLTDTWKGGMTKEEAERKLKAYDTMEKAQEESQAAKVKRESKEASRVETEMQKERQKEIAKLDDEDFKRRLEIFQDEQKALQDNLSIKAEMEYQAAVEEADALDEIDQEREEKWKKFYARMTDTVITAGDEWQEIHKRVAENMSDSFTDAFMSMIQGTESFSQAFKKMVLSILADYAQMQMRKGLTNLIQMGINAAVAYAGTGYNPITGTSAGDAAVGYVQSDWSNTMWAKGGVVPGGFRAFDHGGIVNKPTLGLVGEGSMDEAVVPLPDGKSIPVNMQGGGSGNFVIENLNINAMNTKDAFQFLDESGIIQQIQYKNIRKGNRAALAFSRAGR